MPATDETDGLPGAARRAPTMPRMPCCCSMSTSTATTEPTSGRVTRPAGPALRDCFRCSSAVSAARDCEPAAAAPSRARPQASRWGRCDDSMAGPRTRPDKGCLGGPARGVPQIARPPTIDDIRRLPQHCGQEPRDHRRAPCHLGHYPAGPGHRNPYHGLGCPAHRWVHGERRDPETHPHCPGRWRGMVSLKAGPDGQRRRKKVYGKNKTEVRANPAELHDSERVRRSVHASRTL
jgi:hypothetical protein